MTENRRGRPKALTSVAPSEVAPRPDVASTPAREGAGTGDLGQMTLTIGEFSRATGVRPSVLRDWERLGIVAPVRTGSHRRYTETDLQRVKAARRLRSRNLNPPAIAEILGPTRHARGDGAASRLGPTLRDARKVAGLTLSEVASMVECSASHLSSIERGGSTPSMSLLHRIAQVYQIDVSTLFGEMVEGRPVRTSAYESSPFTADDGRLKVWAVARTASICADIYEAEPGSGSGGSYAHEGEEYIFVLEGVFEITLDENDVYVLATGEALSFSSSTAHEWRNPGDRATRVLWTNTHPDAVWNSCANRAVL